MGLSFSVRAKLPRNGIRELFGRPDWRSRIRGALINAARAANMQDLVPPDLGDTIDRLPAHYCEEWLDLGLTSEELTISGKTSTSGPGYFAMLSNLVDELGKVYGLSFVDESDCDYYRDRNYAALQRNFADWLVSLCGSMTVQNEKNQRLALQLPSNQLLPDWMPDTAFTPHGPVTIQKLVEIAKAPPDVALIEAEAWYPWWNQSAKGSDYGKIAEQLMWVELPWHVPNNKDDRQLMQSTLAVANAAKQNGYDVSRFVREVSEINAFLAPDAPDNNRPYAEGIGYRRKTCQWQIAPGWTAMLPGYWYVEFGEDSYQVYFDDFYIYASSWSIERKSASYDPPQPQEHAQILHRGESDRFSWLLERDNRPQEARMATSYLTATSLNSVLLLTFTHGKDLTLDRLLEIAQGIKLQAKSS